MWCFCSNTERISEMSDKKMRNCKMRAKMGARSYVFMTAFALMAMTMQGWATLKYDVGVAA